MVQKYGSFHLPKRFCRKHVVVISLTTICICIICYGFIIYTAYSDLLLGPFSWSAGVSRNLSQYVRPDINTTLIQPAVNTPCSPFLLVVVQSAVNSFQARTAIRATWGGVNVSASDVRVLFLLGTSADPLLTINVRAEARLHSDLIVEDFVDTYANLTVKTTYMLKWTLSNCPPQFLLKADEDMWIHVPNLLAALRTSHERPLVLGALICGAKPLRSRESKYYMPYDLLPDQRYPDYVSGTAYVLDGTAVRLLYDAALTLPLLHLEDVYLTGLCARAAGLRPCDHVGFSYEERRLDDRCVLERLISAHRVAPEQMMAAWRTLAAPSGQCPTDRKLVRQYKPQGCGK